MKRVLFGVVIVGLSLVGGAVVEGSIVTTYADRPAFDANVGPTTTDDFGTKAAFPISTGVLNASTNLVTLFGGPILPGLIQAGISYSTPIASGFFFNIDSGGGFVGGFLDGGLGTPGLPLTVTFDSPIRAFGFDTNGEMGTSFNITIDFASGPAYLQTFGGLTFDRLQFFGFQSNATDITSVVILGNGGSSFSFALDNFSLSAVPSPTSLLLLGVGLTGLAAWGRKRHIGTGGREDSQH